MILSTLTGTDWVNIIGAISASLTVLGGVIVLIIKTWGDSVLTKLELIKHSVDGTATKQDEQLKAALAKVEFMTNQYYREERKSEDLIEKLAASTPVAPIVDKR